MQSRFTVLALISLLSILGTSFVFGALIDTPTTAVECQPLSLKWHNADPKGSVYISVIEGKDITSQPLIQFQPLPSSTEGTFTWDQVNVTAGTTVTFIISDASGSPSYSGQTTIQKGPKSGTCDAVGSGSSGGASSGTTTPSSKPSSGTTSPSTTNTTTPASSGSSTPSGAKPVSGSTTNTTAPSKPSSGTSGAMVDTHVQSIAVASIAIVLGSILAVNIL